MTMLYMPEPAHGFYCDVVSRYDFAFGHHQIASAGYLLYLRSAWGMGLWGAV